MTAEDSHSRLIHSTARLVGFAECARQMTPGMIGQGWLDGLADEAEKTGAALDEFIAAKPEPTHEDSNLH